MATAVSILSVVSMGLTCMLAGYWLGKVLENARIERSIARHENKKDDKED